MKTSDFLLELQAIDPRITIRPNANRPGLSNVFVGDGEVCPCPSEDIYEEPSASHVFEFPNGMVARHKSMREVREKVTDILAKIADPAEAELFFSRDE